VTVATNTDLFVLDSAALESLYRYIPGPGPCYRFVPGPGPYYRYILPINIVLIVNQTGGESCDPDPSVLAYKVLLWITHSYEKDSQLSILKLW